MADGKPYKREPNAMDVEFAGMNSWRPYDALPPSKYPYAANLRRSRTGQIVGRPQQSTAQIQLDSTLGGVHSLRRMNDTTPAGPGSGYVIISGQGTNLNADAVVVDSGLSGKRISIVPFRPNQSVQPWAYVADDNKMDKVRSDKTRYKMGIKEPQVPATVVFSGGGGTVVPGVNAIYYKYVYRSSATGAQSNPGPASTAGANAQSTVTKTDSATGAPASLFTFDGNQYEFNSNQIRTKGGVPGGVLTNYIVAHNFGFSIPAGMNINGVSIDLNWLGQANGTGILSTVGLFYGGNLIGVIKAPSSPNTTLATDFTAGGSFDLWGAALTSTMVNDASFGFGVAITTAVVSSTDRSFVNSMAMTVTYSSQNAALTPTYSTDPQVDKIDWYRFGNALENYTYVGTQPNSGSFTDTLEDIIAQANKVLEFDNFEPFVSIDLPRSGTVNTDSTTGSVAYVSGDQFNVRWLPGTNVVVGGVPVIADRRPASTTSWTIPGVATATGATYEIAQPLLAQQPMRSMWGPTDNVAFAFACHDPLRPGTLYFCKGNNLDSAPDTNQIEVTSPSEPLMNGCIVGGQGMVFSTERSWFIQPNYFDALSTVTGTQGSPFTLVPATTSRGLYAQMGVCTDGGKTAYYISKDGIYKYPGGEKEEDAITFADLYNIFPHEGVAAVDVTYGNTGIVLHHPDYSQPDQMGLSFANGYLYFDYVDTESVRRTLVYDPSVKGWCVDSYGTPVLAHSGEEGQAEGTLTGCSDGSIRILQ